MCVYVTQCSSDALRCADIWWVTLTDQSHHFVLENYSVLTALHTESNNNAYECNAPLLSLSLFLSLHFQLCIIGTVWWICETVKRQKRRFNCCSRRLWHHRSLSVFRIQVNKQYQSQVSSIFQVKSIQSLRSLETISLLLHACMNLDSRYRCWQYVVGKQARTYVVVGDLVVGKERWCPDCDAVVAHICACVARHKTTRDDDESQMIMHQCIMGEEEGREECCCSCLDGSRRRRWWWWWTIYFLNAVMVRNAWTTLQQLPIVFLSSVKKGNSSSSSRPTGCYDSHQVYV